MGQTKTAVAIVFPGVSAPLAAQDGVPAVAADICAAKSQAMSDIETRYKPQQDAIQRDGEDIGGDAVNARFSAVIDFKMNEQKIIFDLPSIVMQTKAMALDLPQTMVKTRQMSWDEPTVVMQRTKTGEYPEFKCRGFLKCTVRWSPIYMDVPTVEMRRKNVSLDLPEFRMDRTNFKADVPQMTMHRQTWIAKIPEITLRNPMLEAEKLKRRGEALKTQAEELAARIQQDAAEGSSQVFACYRDDVTAKRTAIAGQFDIAIAQMEAGIGAIGGAGGDASKVASDGQTVDLIAQRNALVVKRNEALTALDAVLADLLSREKAAVTTIIA